MNLLQKLLSTHCLCSLCLSLSIAVPAFAAEPADPTAGAETQPVSYFRDIKPIFQAHCHGCHQPAKQSGEYVMTDFAKMVAGGETGEAAIVPGKPDESYLLSQVTPTDGKAEMPKDAPVLAASEVDLIRRWIGEGAKDDTPMSAREIYTVDNPPIYHAPPVINSLDYSPDGTLLAVAGYHEVVLHKTDGSGIAARLVGLSERIESAKFSPDGKSLAVTGGSPGRMGEVQIWDVETKELTLAKTVGYDTIYGVSWAPDGSQLAFGCPDNTVRAIDPTGKQVLFNGAHDDWVLDTVYSVKGDHLVTVSRDRSMKLMNVPTERFIDNVTSITPGALKGGLSAVDRHPGKDELLCGGADGEPKLYKMFRDKDRKIGDDFNLIRKYPALTGRVFDLTFNKDGSQLAACSSIDGRGEVALFETETAKELMRVKVDAGGLYTLAIHPDGNRVAVAGFDGKVRVYEIPTGELKSEFYPVELTADDDK